MKCEALKRNSLILEAAKKIQSMENSLKIHRKNASSLRVNVCKLEKEKKALKIALQERSVENFIGIGPSDSPEVHILQDNSEECDLPGSAGFIKALEEKESSEHQCSLRQCKPFLLQDPYCVRSLMQS